VREVFSRLFPDDDPVPDVEEVAETLMDDVVGTARWSVSRNQYRHSWFVFLQSGKTAMVRRPASVSVRACRLAAAMGSVPTQLTAQNRRWREEVSWQMRRFVDVISAMKARKPWPNLEETP